jgi:hypothetical protein
MTYTNQFIVKFFSLTLALTLLFLFTPANAQTVEETAQDVVKQDLSIVTDGMHTIMIKEEEMAEVRHILNYLLQNARDHAAAENFESAAYELSMAASYMNMDARNRRGEMDRDVMRAAENLKRIASATDYSKTPVNVYDAGIFTAHQELADYHQRRTSYFHSADFTKSAGHALEAALVHYQSAAFSLARLEEKPMKSLIDADLQKDVETLALAMKQSKPIADADASAIIDRLGIAIESLAKSMS